MSDIVQKLRSAPFSPGRIQDMREEAAAEIERLRAALRAIITSDPPKESDNWYEEWRRLVFSMKGIARTALEQSSTPYRDAVDDVNGIKRSS